MPPLYLFSIRLASLLLICCIGTPEVFAQVEAGKLFYEQAVNAYKEGIYDKAMLSGLKADSVFQIHGDVTDQLKSKTLLAKINAVRRQSLQAAQFSEAAIALLGSAGKQDSLIEADILNTYGGSLMELRRFDECEAAYQRAIEIKKKILGGQTSEIGIQVSNLANLYFKKGELSKAMRYGKEGIAIREGGISPNPNLLTAYTNLGIIHKQVGLYPQALDYYGKVAQVIEREPKKYQEKAAPLYQSLANLYHELGDFDKAKQYHELALQNFSRQYGPQSQQVGNVYYNLALIAGDLGEGDSRVKYAQKALTIFQNDGVQDPAWIADCYEQICIAFLKSNPDSSLYFAELARALLDTAGIKDGVERASNLSYIATAYANKGNFYLADSLMSIAVSQMRAVFGNRHILTANYLTNHANILVQAGQYEGALSLYDASLEAYGYSEGCKWDTVIHADQLLENLGRKNDVLARLYDQSPSIKRKAEIESRWSEILQLLDFLRRRYQGTEAKLLFASNFGVLAETAIQWYAPKIDKESQEMAWKFAEKARSLALLEAFRSAGAWNSSTAADSLRAFAETYAAEKKKWHDLYTATESEAERSDFLLKFMETDRKQELWLQTLEHADSLFYKAKYDNQTVASEAVCTMLAPDEALLEYFIGDNSIFIFVFRADTFIIQEVKRDFPLEDWIEHLRQGLYGYYAPEKSELPTPLYEASVNKYGEFAQKIYQKLFAPVQDWLPEKVIVVPDGVLSYISFDALLTGAPLDVKDFKSYPYLLNRHQFSYSYSATLHREMREKQHRLAQEKELVAFAPFYPGNDSSSQRKTDDTRQGFGPLYYTRMEVEQVQKWMGGEVFLQNDATESRFRETASRYRMIHLATHGVADNRVGDYAFLGFAKAKDSSGLDLLYVKDIYLLQLNADMVVLSACETGIGRLRRGEGMISLARAFAYAGAKSIITSLWSVNNKSTAELMSLFYAELHEGKSKDEALREARLRYFDKAAPRNLHPFFWAAFVPVGDMRPVR